jgi:hypothetical protein
MVLIHPKNKNKKSSRREGGENDVLKKLLCFCNPMHIIGLRTRIREH